MKILPYKNLQDIEIADNEIKMMGIAEELKCQNVIKLESIFID